MPDNTGYVAPGENCAYCGQPATEREHVIARQFYYGNAPQKQEIPIVPTCRECNGKKQKAEDIAAFALTLISGEKSANDLFDKKALGIISNNHKLAKMLGRMREAYIRMDAASHFNHYLSKESPIKNISPRNYTWFNTKFYKSGVITLEDQEMNILLEFFEWIVRGLYYFITHERIPSDRKIMIFRLNEFKEKFGLFNHVSNSFNLKPVSFAVGEFSLQYDILKDKNSVWFFRFRSVEIYALTHDYQEDDIKKAEHFQWKRK